ncbi:MAG: DUF4290 domain-containing protein [Flavobacteriales bacterium]|nr:DUF4290 domain-containing protein [Flavobacteriales bacterium]
MEESKALEGITYNSQRSEMIIPEYGRTVQGMVEHCKELEDKEERSKCAKAIISVMRTLVPGDQEMRDYDEKLWGHLHVLAGFELDIDAPFPVPPKPIEDAGPEKLLYPHKPMQQNYYGRIVEDLIAKCIEYPEGEEKAALTLLIANLLKRQYLTWNRESVEDPLIRAQLREMSGGKLDAPAEVELTSTSAILQSKRKTSDAMKRKGKGGSRSGGNRGGGSRSGQGGSRGRGKNRRR